MLSLKKNNFDNVFLLFIFILFSPQFIFSYTEFLRRTIQRGPTFSKGEGGVQLFRQVGGGQMLISIETF